MKVNAIRGGHADLSTTNRYAEINTKAKIQALRSTKEQSRAGWYRRRADLAHLADVAGELAAVERRAADLDRRSTELLALAIS